MPTKCAITGTVVAPDGSPIPLAKVSFTPSDGRSAVGIRPLPPLSIAPEEATATTDEFGALEVELYPGQYSVRVTRALRSGFPTFQITVPDAAFAVLSDIQNLAPPVPLNEAQLAVLAAQAARDEAVAARIGIEEAEGRAAESAADADGSAQAAGASAAAAAGSAGAAGTAADAAAGSAAAAAADRTQTGQDRAAVASDRSEVETLRSAVAADRAQTGEDRGAAAASAAAALGSENAAAGSAGDAAGSAAAAAASEEAAAQRASEAAADRTQTGQDRAATAADREQTGADRVATGEDRAATGTDRAQTGEDRAATAADRMATDEDRLAAAGSAAAALADRIAADAAVIAAQAARDAALLAAVPLGTEILWRSNVPFPAGWSDTGSRLLSGTSERALLWNFSPLALFSVASRGIWFDPSDLSTMAESSGGSPAVTPAQPVGLSVDKSGSFSLGPELVVNGNFSSTDGWFSSISAETPLSPGDLVEGALPLSVSYNNAGRALSSTLSIGSAILVKFRAKRIGTGSALAVLRLSTRYGASGPPALASSGLTEEWQQFSGFCYVPSSGLTHMYIREQIGTGGVALVDDVSIREIGGYPGYQAVAASRPTLARQPKGGRRNLLTATTNFADSAWAKTGLAPVGDLLAETAATASHYMYQSVQPVAAGGLTFAVDVKPAGRSVVQITSSIGLGGSGVRYQNYDLATGTLGGSAGSPAASIEALDDGWYRIVYTDTATAAAADTRFMFVVVPAANSGRLLSYLGDGVSGIRVRNPQIELGSEASPSQRVDSIYDVTEAGVRDCWYLYTDPVDDGLSVTVPAGGWSNATIMVARETGITVLTGQTIPAGAWALPLPRPSKCFGLVAINRALSAMETALLTRYLNLKRGAE